MRLSVVIPAHNEAEVVEPTLRGLIEQLGPEEIDYEIVVVDDASSDGTGDVVAAFEAFAKTPRAASVYNLGGGRACNCSMLEAIRMCEEIAGRKLDWTYSEENRIGDHRWWVSDLSAFERDHPQWSLRYSVEDILRQIHDANAELWAPA